MNLLKTLLAGVTGTACMTLYSYVRSRDENKQFREPLLLHRLLNKSPLPDTDETPDLLKHLDGWLVHFGTGVMFSAVYDRIWRKHDKPSIPEGAAMGAASGLVGVLIWEASFRLHPDPPKIDRKAYYRHLLAAHTMFGIFSSVGYRQPVDSDMKKLAGEDSGTGANRKWDPGDW